LQVWAEMKGAAQRFGISLT